MYTTRFNDFQHLLSRYFSYEFVKCQKAVEFIVIHQHASTLVDVSVGTHNSSR